MECVSPAEISAQYKRAFAKLTTETFSGYDLGKAEHESIIPKAAVSHEAKQGEGDGKLAGCGCATPGPASNTNQYPGGH